MVSDGNSEMSLGKKGGNGPPLVSEGKDFEKQLLALSPQLKNFALSLCRDNNAADDWVQDTLLKAWKYKTSFAMGTNLRAWLFTILRNEYRSFLRKRPKGIEVSTTLNYGDRDREEGGTFDIPTPPGQEEYMEVQDLKRRFKMIPADQLEALILVAINGMAYKEVATLQGCPEGTVKSRVSRARASLYKALDKPLPPSVSRAQTSLEDPGLEHDVPTMTNDVPADSDNLEEKSVLEKDVAALVLATAGFSEEDIHKILAISKSTVRQYVSKAHARLQRTHNTLPSEEGDITKKQ